MQTVLKRCKKAGEITLKQQFSYSSLEGGCGVSTNIRIIELEKLDLKEPVLIQGLPGIGFVGKIAVDFFIEQLKPSKFAEAYSTYLTLPDGDVGVKIELDGTYALPKYEFYAFFNRVPHIIFLTGDTQPRPWGQYHVTESVLDFVERFGCNTVIALGGYSTPQSLDTVYAVSNDLKLIDKYRSRVQVARGGAVRGAFGVILGLAEKRGMNCLGLLGATRGVYPDLRSSRNVVQIVADVLDLPVDLRSLDRDIANIDAKMKKLQQIGLGMPVRERPEKEREPARGYIT